MSSAARAAGGQPPAPTLDLREPMALAARAVARRLDLAQAGRPWFKLRGEGGIPVAPEHDTWDFGDMTGRYLEGLILARHMGVTAPDLSEAEGRLGRYLLKLQGPDGLIRRIDSGDTDPGSRAWPGARAPPGTRKRWAVPGSRPGPKPSTTGCADPTPPPSTSRESP